MIARERRTPVGEYADQPALDDERLDLTTILSPMISRQSSTRLILMT
jgi:hypothetical protein